MKKSNFPPWLYQKIPPYQSATDTQKILHALDLPTVCQEAQCPNRGFCFAKKRATFLTLGSFCTRSCGFCSIDYCANPKAPDPKEPSRIALAIKKMGLSHVVLTMVTRDDLSDGGSHHLISILQKIKKIKKPPTIEILTSDFQENFSALDALLQEKPEIFNHNLETIQRLTPSLRHKALYGRSLKVLEHAKQLNTCVFIKSGLMVGLGEKPKEVKESILDLFHVGVDIITIGQYLQPHAKKHAVKEFIHPSLFLEYENYGKSLGIEHMFCGPLVRSSFLAEEIFLSLRHSSKEIVL